MYIYGKNVAHEYLDSNKKIDRVFLSNNFNDNEIISKIRRKNIRCKTLSKFDMDKKVNGLHQGIILEVEDYKYSSLEELLSIENGFLVMLDHIEDPHNFGAIIRTSECAGVDYIIIPKKGNVEVNATVMKTSAGALTNTKICVVPNLNNTIELLKKAGYWIVGTDADGQDYTKIDYNGKVALVIGSEGNGLKELVRKSCDFIASIPMKGKVNSLNASVAAGIMIYEVLKTRK